MMELPRIMGIGSADALGTFGLLLAMGAYLFLQLGLIRGEGYLYPTLNLIASIALLISLMEMFNLYSALGEIAWIAISLLGITRLFILRRYFRLTSEEERAGAALAPSLDLEDMRVLLRMGEWKDLEPGARLAAEDTPVDALWYIDQGRCRVEHGGTTVAMIGPGGLIGEITYRTGAPATASVFAETPLRGLRFDASALRDLLARKPRIDSALEFGVAGDLRRKLAQTTQSLTGPGRDDAA